MALSWTFEAPMDRGAILLPLIANAWPLVYMSRVSNDIVSITLAVSLPITLTVAERRA